jgi:Pyruvate/2-oxoacid:ferredoxin oxidoreductase delta subunit
MKLETVRRAIRKKGASWIAGETALSDLTREALRAGHSGAQSDNEINRLSEEGFRISTELQDRIEAFGGMDPPGTRFNWLNDTDNGGMQVITPAKDQSPGGIACNSCVAFAVVAAIEARMNILAVQPAGEVNLSEGYLFFGGCGICCENGWSTIAALTTSQSGIPNEEAFPYDPATTQRPGPVQPIVYLNRWSKVMNPSEIKRAIQIKGPVVAEMTIFEDLKHYRSGVYEHVSGREIGQHAVSVIGYDDAPVNGDPPHWICKNSWGTDWGFDPRTTASGGFFRIRYGDSGMGSLPVFDLDIQIELTLQEATAVIDKVVAAVQEHMPLKTCLQGVYLLGQGTAFCQSSHLEVVSITQDVLAAYPVLKDRLINGIS